MFCIHHNVCRNVGDNGNCVTYIPARVVRVNMGQSICGCIDQSVVTGEKTKVVVKKRNPLKQSKRGK